MKPDWKRVAARIDDMSLRERALLLASAGLVLVAAVYLTLIDPLLIRQKSMIEHVKRDQSQVNAARSQIEAAIRQEQAEAENPAQQAVRELERRVAEAEQELAKRQRAFIAAERLPALLTQMLGGKRKVRLESLRLLPGTALQKPMELYRHGVELTLKGSYFELMEYLAELEKLPFTLSWGRVELQVDGYPEVKLTLVAYTFSPQRSLLAN